MSASLDFTTGRDGSIRVLLPTGLITLNYTSFDAQQQTHQVVSRPVNGLTTMVELPDHWTVKFEIDRNSPDLENYIGALEAAYWANGATPLNAATIYQYINEIDGSVSTWALTKCTLKLSNAGTYKQEDKVSQSLDVSASTRVKV